MNCNFNTFALSKKVILVSNLSDNEAEIMTSVSDYKSALPLLIQYQLMQYGKSLTKKAYTALCNEPQEIQEALANDVKIYLTDLYGNYGSFDSLFGNFPNTVLSMNDFEMALHTIAQYFTDGAYFPKDYNMSSLDSEDKSINWGLCVKEKYEMIDAIDATGFAKIYTNILKAEQSLTDWDKEAIIFLGKHMFPEMESALEKLEDIPFKETLCLCVDTLGYKPKTVTDILRYVTYLSGGDIALPTIPKMVSNGWSTRKATSKDLAQFHFRKFNRAERKHILELVETILKKHFNDGLIDLKRYAMRWIRLGEIVHPSEYAKRFPLTAKAFDRLRNDAQNIRNWAGEVNKAREDFNFEKMLSLYEKRPGEFARAIDSVIRLFGEDDSILASFQKVIGKISTKLLYEVSEHFFHRTEKAKRFISPKGSKSTIELSSLEPISKEYVNKIMTIFIQELVRRYTEKGSLEGQTYYISDSLKNIVPPTNMRTASIASLQVARGTRIPLPENSNLIRLYCHWIDPNASDDLDLSATFSTEEGNKEALISWNRAYSFTNKKGRKYAQFSGDCRHHRGNCAEYIDIDINESLAEGWRYVTAMVADFDGHNFRNAYTGLMARKTWGTQGETTWAPETVENEFKITSKCQNVCMGIIDLKTREFILVDEDVAGIPVTSHNSRVKTFLNKFAADTSSKFWNAYKIILSNLTARNAKISTLTEEEIANGKIENENALEALKEERARVLAVQELSDEALETYEAEFEKKKNALESINFISFADILKDYTTIFEYMF